MTRIPPLGGSSRHVLSLDGLRGVAISLVMLYHFWGYKGDSAAGVAIGSVAGMGWAGVDIFFALSGFLITGILLESRDSPRYWRNFYIRRTLRIFPIYYAVMTAVVIAGVVVAVSGIPIRDPSLQAIDRAWVNYLYLTNIALAIKGHDWVPLDIAWSLAMEEQFYLLFPFLVRWASPRALFWTLAAVCVATPLIRILAFWWSDGAYYVPYAFPLCRMDNLAVGGMAAVLMRQGATGACAFLARAAPALWVSAIAAHVAWNRGDPEFVVLGYSLVGLATSATIVRLLIRPSRVLGPMLSWRPLVYTGQISYGLYLLHLIARAAVDQGPLQGLLAGHRTDLALSVVRVSVIAALAMLAAGLSWKYFEKPILRLKDRWAPA